MAPLLRRSNTLWFLVQLLVLGAVSLAGWRRGKEQAAQFASPYSVTTFEGSNAAERPIFAPGTPGSPSNVVFFVEDGDLGALPERKLRILEAAANAGKSNVRVVLVGSPHSAPIEHVSTSKSASLKSTRDVDKGESLLLAAKRLGLTVERLPYSTLPTETGHPTRQARSVLNYLRKNKVDINATVFTDSRLAFLALSAFRAGAEDPSTRPAVAVVDSDTCDHIRIDSSGDSQSALNCLDRSQRELDAEAAYMDKKSLEWADLAATDPDNLESSVAKAMKLTSVILPAASNLTFSEAGGHGLPMVSVIITVHNRFDFLEAALRSIETQDYAGLIETIVVDDASLAPGANEKLSKIMGGFNAGSKLPLRTFKLLMLDVNVYLGKARNEGRKLARGDVLMFMDDDNVAKSYEIRTFVHALSNSRETSIFTCFSDSFSGEQPPVEPVANPALIEYHFLPFGGSLASGAFGNTFGDANFAIRASAFDAMGGFSEDRFLSLEDWEFLARAQFAGYEIGIIPKVLFWKRTLGDSMLRANARDEFRQVMSEWRTLKPYFFNLPPGAAFPIAWLKRGTDVAKLGPVLANSWDDWDGRQGTLGWNMGYRVREDTKIAGFRPFEDSETTSNGRELFGPPPMPRWLHVSRGKQHGAVDTGESAKSYMVVRKWTSDVAVRSTTIKVSVTRPDHVVNCGDGAAISIVVFSSQGKQLEKKTEVFGPKQKEALLEMTSVEMQVGMVVEFWHDPRESAECDELWLRGRVLMDGEAGN